jgi:ribosome-associated translation inhibitor RaiA
MQVQVNSDASVAVDAALSSFVESHVSSSLSRFADQIIRVEIHLSDVNSEKFGERDKRCLMEARPSGADPVTVTEEAATVDAAVRGAARKMSRLLTSRLGRAESRR